MILGLAKVCESVGREKLAITGRVRFEVGLLGGSSRGTKLCLRQIKNVHKLVHVIELVIIFIFFVSVLA